MGNAYTGLMRVKALSLGHGMHCAISRFHENLIYSAYSFLLYYV